MKLSVCLRLCGSILFLSLSIFAQRRDFTHWVDPFIGTGGHGHTFPGATMPFGMVQLSPDTRGADWDGSSGYHYSDDIIYGFSHTHLSGTGIPDYCDILFMPTVGEPQFLAKEGDKSVNGYASKFSHANEKAETGYYSVKLDDDGILAEMTATKRVALHRYSFPKTREANIVLDLAWRDKPLWLEVNIVSDRKLVGSRRSSSWAKDQTVVFVAEFSKPFLKSKISGPKTLEDHWGLVVGNDLKASFNFDTSDGNPVLLKVALSAVSIAGAEATLAAELPGWNFDKVRADAKAAWNKELSKIEVSGGTDDQTKTFYTALYHTMIQPNIFNDVDGNYRGLDGKVHRLGESEGGTKRGRDRNRSVSPSRSLAVSPSQYTVFSLWDTFRAAHPLYTIIDQRRTADFINTFIRMYEQGGRLPVWELAGNETDTMIGYHAVSVIADAMAKGIKGFDYEKAYKAAKHSAELDRDGLAAYKRRGYISQEDENESVSKTLEYAYDDWCIMSMAATLYNTRSLGKTKTPGDAKYLEALKADIDRYNRRAGNFENLFDPETRFFRPKQNGGFVKPFAPNDVTFHFTEGNSWQYSFFVPHNVSRLMQLMGGEAKFNKKLDELFTTKQQLAGREQPDITGLIGQYAHGNEPSHHIAYLYNYAAAPSKTQKRVRQIMDEFYRRVPDGLIGNEDCGQMSAWYVLSASGFYPVVPGQTRYDLGSPIFKEISYHLENGKKFTVKAPKVSPANFYIKSAKWNGEPHPFSYIVHEQIMAGGVLELEMSDKPNDNGFESFSVSSVFHEQPAVPVIDGGGRVFDASTTVTLTATSRNARIHYTLDGREPSTDSPVYKAPITIDRTTTVKAIAVFGSGGRSLVAEATFHKKPNDWTVKIDSKYNRQYTGGGDNGLIDGIRGSTNFASGEWQGYQGQDLVATVDLQKQTQILTLGAGFLQNARSWIWMPTHIEFELSQDGVNFSRAADIKTDVAVDDMESKIRDYSTPIKPSDARYVRIRAYNLGKIPSWHPGAGNEAFIFIDEIFIG